MTLASLPTGLAGQSTTVAAEPEVKLGGSYDDPTDQFGIVAGAHRLADGSLLVLDQLPPAVRLYAEDGRFIRDIGRDGDGPGEFRRPIDFVVQGTTVLVLEATGRRTWFDLEGTVVRTDRVSLEGCASDFLSRAAGLNADGSVVVRCEERLFGKVRGEYRQTVGLLLADEGGVEMLGVFPADSGRVDSGPIPIPRPYLPSRRLLWAANDRSVFVAPGTGSEVLSFDLADGLSTSRLQLDVEDRPTRDEDVTASIREALRIGGSENDRRVVEEWYREMPRTARTPVFRSLLASQDGALWVETWAEGASGSTWLRVEPGSGGVSPVVVPFQGRLLDAGADWTVWRIQDDFGVDRVQLHRTY